jgi:hypothetical protein
MLLRCANGFGAVAAAALLAEPAYGRLLQSLGSDPLAPRPGHFPAKARHVIFLYMDGGPSQVDTFDPKPRLDAEHGQPIKLNVPATQFDDVGTVLRSPWKFQPYGESGIEVSELFRHVGECVDDLAFIRSMTSHFSEHPGANFFMHTGHGPAGRPSVGSWLNYGLGSLSENLPGFMVLNGGLIPPGGLEVFGSGFLPAAYQASLLRADAQALENIIPNEERPELQNRKLDLVRKLDANVLGRLGDHDALEAAIRNHELAAQMQSAVPDLVSLEGESDTIKKMYGLEAEYGPTRTYGTLCLLARRMIQRGVRFIELTCPDVGADRWDQHSNLEEGHANNARAVDQPIAALLKDLRGLGLLDSTLVVWGGEFGRTPMAQGSSGRDHNPFGFTMWLAGGGVKGGTVYGATDEYGYFAVENRTEVYDLHATILHLLGLDHKRLTFRFSGRDMRLTDVHGELIEGILA